MLLLKNKQSVYVPPKLEYTFTGGAELICTSPLNSTSTEGFAFDNNGNAIDW